MSKAGENQEVNQKVNHDEAIDLGQTMPSLPRVKRRAPGTKKSTYAMDTLIELDQGSTGKESGRESSKESPTDHLVNHASKFKEVGVGQRTDGSVSNSNLKPKTQEAARQNYHAEVPNYQCPACGAKLREESIICTACGFNLMSGQVMDSKMVQQKSLIDKIQGWLRCMRKQ